MESGRSSKGLVYDLEPGGRDRPLVLVMAALGGGRAEWRPVLAELASALPELGFLAYDRPGYGDSAPLGGEETPRAEARAAYLLAEELGPDRPILALGHSLGGLHALALARDFPDRLAGLVLVDPLTPWDYEFKARLSPKDFAASGADKSAGYRLGAFLGRFGLLPLFKGLLASSPPLSCRSDWSGEDRAEILRLLTRRSTYETALREYRLAREPRGLEGLDSPEGFPALPLRLLVHAPLAMVAELEEYGAAPDAARRIEGLWRGLFERLLAYSPDSRLSESKSGSHYLQHAEPGLLLDALRDIVA